MADPAFGHTSVHVGQGEVGVQANCLIEFDLSNADLGRLNFENADLSGADFFGANLSKTSFVKAKLSNAQFVDARFSDIRPGTRKESVMDQVYGGISHANLDGANMSGASFSLQGGFRPAQGLLQRKLNEACADPRIRPRLKGVRDAETRSPIDWRGDPRNDKSSN